MKSRNEFIQNYWGKNYFTKKILSSPNVSMEEWYLLIPNNVKRRYGFPTSRTFTKRKSIHKRKIKQNISFKVFSTTLDTVKEMIANNFEYDNSIEDKIK